ncbi:MAG: hypothetical protein M0Z46_19070 [Actinomycetota bacterium]|nr:hypothetical protein [Actinomycetota bacterium]
MRTLYLTLIGLTLLFACAMSFAVLGVYTDTWWPAVVAGGLLVVSLAIGGAVFPRCFRSLSGGYRRTARAAVIMSSSWWGLAFFMMALINWILGKRVVGPNNAYLTLGLLIFLGFVGMGIQGVLAMTAWFVHVRNQSIVVPARRERLEREARGAPLGPDDHGSLPDHSVPMSRA